VYNPQVTQYDYGDIVIVGEPISVQRLLELAAARFGDMVKAVVDTNRRVLLGATFILMRKQRCWNGLPNRKTCGASISIRRSHGRNGSSLIPS
jgi:hypothetical protein